MRLSDIHSVDNPCPISDFTEAATLYFEDRGTLLTGLGQFSDRYEHAAPTTNIDQHEARRIFEPLAEAARGLTKQIDQLYKHFTQLAAPSDIASMTGGTPALMDRRAATKLTKRLDAARREAVEQLNESIYFYRQVAWLQDRFPTATMQAVPGLCKVLARSELAADCSLTPGRYVDVAPPDDDEADFEQALRDIHLELHDLDTEAAGLANKIQLNFEELGI